MLPPELPTAAQDDEGDEENRVGDVVCPDILLHKALHVLHKGEDGHKGEGHRELDGQHQENLRAQGQQLSLVTSGGKCSCRAVLWGTGRGRDPVDQGGGKSPLPCLDFPTRGTRLSST